MSSSYNPVARHAPVTKAPPLTIIGSSPVFAERDAWSRAVAADRRLPPRVRLIALRLGLFKSDPTYDDIGSGAGCSRRTAIRAVAILIDRGWLEKIVSRGRVANHYRRVMRVAS
jgi:hypothetical protein